MRWGSEAKEGEHLEVFSVDDVAEWCARQVDSGGCGKVSAEHRAKILQAVGEHEVDREVLATFTEDDIVTLFGFSVVGQRRKVMLRIKELCDPNMTARSLAPVFWSTDTKANWQRAWNHRHVIFER